MTSSRYRALSVREIVGGWSSDVELAHDKNLSDTRDALLARGIVVSSMLAAGGIFTGYAIAEVLAFSIAALVIPAASAVFLNLAMIGVSISTISVSISMPIAVKFAVCEFEYRRFERTPRHTRESLRPKRWASPAWWDLLIGLGIAAFFGYAILYSFIR